MGRSRRTFFAPTSHESKLVAKKVEEEKHIFITFSSLNIFYASKISRKGEKLEKI
jgi:hypothetical protein